MTINYKMRINNSQVINGSIEHIDIGTDTEVYCDNCPKLKKLPNWKNVTYVDCSYCPKLKELPNWQNVTYVNCRNCPELTELPNWKNVTFVYCRNCPELTELPNWQNITYVNCSDCSKLKELPTGWKLLRCLTSDLLTYEECIKKIIIKFESGLIGKCNVL